MSVRKNESRCQNTAFLFGNVQIWIHWTHRHDEKIYFKLGSSLSRIRRCQRDDFVFFFTNLTSQVVELDYYYMIMKRI